MQQSRLRGAILDDRSSVSKRFRRHLTPVLLLFALGFGGYFKGLPLVAGLPVDLTVLAALGVALVLGHRVLANRGRSPSGTFPIALLWGTFLLGVPPVWDGYAAEKTLKIFSLVLLSAIGSLYILRSPAARRIWLQINVIAAIMISVLILIFPNQEAGDTGRLALEGSNTIGSGRAIGAGVVVLLTLVLSRKRQREVFLTAALGLAAAMIGSGSRGPVLAAVTATLVVAVASSRRGRLGRLALGAIAAIGAGYLALQMNLVSDRLLSTRDQSAEYRRLLWSATSDLIASNPLGIGWGRLYFYDAGQILVESGEAQYPHNLFLEVASEAGWVAGIALAIVAWLSFSRQRRAATGSIEMAMLGLLVFHLLSAMVSGDVNDNRGVWISIGAALVLGPSDSSIRKRAFNKSRSGGRGSR